MNFSHKPVLLNEVLDILRPERGGIFVDGTLGGGGHAEAMLERLPKGSRYIGVDRDTEAIAAASERLKRFGDSFTAIHGNFFDLPSLLAEIDIQKVDGVLFDFGVSSHQLDVAERGFSYHADAPLDMRMDQTVSFSAYDVVNTYSFEQLCRILREYGEERYADRIADRIIREREKEPIASTGRLSEIVSAAMPKKSRYEQQHPARRTFQAVRIEVNHELDGLREAVDAAHGLLNPSGRLAILTFHSLEDRIVKQAFRSYENPCTCPPSAPICICGKKPTGHILTKKPLTATEEELRDNSRASCAKLRGIEKL